MGRWVKHCCLPKADGFISHLGSVNQLRLHFHQERVLIWVEENFKGKSYSSEQIPPKETLICAIRYSIHLQTRAIVKTDCSKKFRQFITTLHEHLRTCICTIIFLQRSIYMHRWWCSSIGSMYYLSNLKKILYRYQSNSQSWYTRKKHMPAYCDILLDEHICFLHLTLSQSKMFSFYRAYLGLIFS